MSRVYLGGEGGSKVSQVRLGVDPRCEVGGTNVVDRGGGEGRRGRRGMF